MDWKTMEQQYQIIGEIILELQKGDDSRFEELYDLTKKMAYFELKSAGISENDMEDLLQDVYIKIYKNAGSIKDVNASYKWIKQLAYRTGINYVKSSIVMHEQLLSEEGEYLFETEDSLSSPLPLPEDVMENRESQRLIREILESLPDIQYKMILAYYFNESSVKEIANDFGIPEGTVKINLFRARDEIRKKVEILEKKQGTKLYSLAPIPLFMLLFQSEANACELPNVLQQNGIVSKSVSKMTTAGNAAKKAETQMIQKEVATIAKNSAMEVAKKTGYSLGIKIAIATVAITIIGAVGISVYNANKKENYNTSIVLEKKNEGDGMIESTQTDEIMDVSDGESFAENEVVETNANEDTTLDENVYTDKSFSANDDMYSEKEGTYKRNQDGVWELTHVIHDKEDITSNLVALYVLVQNGWDSEEVELQFNGSDGAFEYEDGTRVSSDALIFHAPTTSATKKESLDSGTIYCFVFTVEDAVYNFYTGGNIYVFGYDGSSQWDFDGDDSMRTSVKLKGRKSTNIYAMMGNSAWMESYLTAMELYATNMDSQFPLDWAEQTYYPAGTLEYDTSIAARTTDDNEISASGLNYEGEILVISNNGDGTYLCNIDGKDVELTIADDADIKMTSFTERSDIVNYLISIPGADFKKIEWGFGTTYDGCELYNCNGYFYGYAVIVDGVIVYFAEDFMA
ncbi:MAG: RNA polymerase sigma factor [Lachnospira sp.]